MPARPITPQPRLDPGRLIALLAGAGYFLISGGFILPIHLVQGWLLAAWLADAAVFSAHTGYEYFHLKNPPRLTAIHAATPVAAAAFGLALIVTAGGLRLASAIPFGHILLALLIWPAVTALPAFLLAYLPLSLLDWLRRRTT